MLQEYGLRQWLCKAVGEHHISRYVAQVDPYSCRQICRKIVLGCTVYNCNSGVDCDPDARDQWLWIGDHVRGSRDAELIQDMRHLWKSGAAFSEVVVFAIGRDLASGLLFSQSPVDRSSKSDDQSTCRFIVIRASSIVRIDRTSQCAFCFSS